MSESINNNRHGDKIALELETYDACPGPGPGRSPSPSPSTCPWPGFAAQILQASTHSVSLDWTPFAGAQVYSIERYHKRRGWQRAAWSVDCTQSVDQLEENFGYRLRVKALQQSADGSHYEALAISPDIVVSSSCDYSNAGRALSLMTSPIG